jgi:hypothetical protein
MRFANISQLSEDELNALFETVQLKNESVQSNGTDEEKALWAGIEQKVGNARLGLS